MVLIEHVFCLSNASLEIYPDNTLSKFTHRFPQPIKVPTGLQPLVSLREFVLSNHPSANAPKVSFLKVHLEELDPVAGPEVNDRRLLATLPNKTGRLNWIRPDYPVLCPLGVTDQIEEFSFLITDEWNRQLQLKDGPTTVIHLTIIMTDSHQSFTMSVGPDTSKHLFSHNSLTTFSVEMPETLDLSDNWEVALLSAQAGNSVVVEDSRLKFVLHTGKQQLMQESSMMMGAHPDDEVLEVSSRKHNLTDATLVDKYLSPWLKDHGFSISLNLLNGAIQIARKEEAVINVGSELNASSEGLDEIRSLEMSLTACKALRITTAGPNGMLINLSHRKNEPVFLRRPIENYTPMLASLRFHTPVLEHLAIYCDLAENSIIGNELAPIMDVVPTRKLHLLDTEADAFYSMKHPVFRRVNPHVRRTFDVALRSLDGSAPHLIYDEHDFNAIKHPIVLTFVFRRRRQ